MLQAIEEMERERLDQARYIRNVLLNFEEGLTSSEEEMDEALLPGMKVYQTYCASCHMMSGKGAPGMNPPLIDTKWVLGDKERLIKVVLNGLSDPIEIKGEIYQNIMASHAFLTDQQIADVLSFIRNNWGNSASYITVDEVAETRANNN